MMDEAQFLYMNEENGVNEENEETVGTPSILHSVFRIVLNGARTICKKRRVRFSEPLASYREDTRVRRSWYVQFTKTNSKSVSIHDNKVYMNFSRGKVNMRILPQVGDYVHALSAKHIIYEGKIIKDFGDFYILKLNIINPVYTGKYFKRNWTLNKEG